MVESSNWLKIFQPIKNMSNLLPGQPGWKPTTSPPTWDKAGKFFTTSKGIKFFTYTGLPLILTAFVYRFQHPYEYTSKFKPYKQGVKEITSGITASLVELREKEKVDLGNKSVEQLAPLVCKNSSNKTDCSNYWTEYHKEFLQGVETNTPPKLNYVRLYAKKYVSEHESHGHH